MKPYYQEDGITIYHGDCREFLSDKPNLDPATLLLTDPPYGLNLSEDLWSSQRGRIKKSKWDSAPFPDLNVIVGSADTAIVWGGNYYSLPLSRGWLSWLKPDAVPSMSQFELAWTNIDMVARQFVYCISQTNPERVGHPTQKPVALMKWCISFSEIGDVLDPFMGSGTTLRAAKDLGRQAIGIEIEERYCEIAAKRLDQKVLQF